MIRRGFTLVELLVVLALLGLVATTLALHASAAHAEGARWALRGDLRSLDDAARALARHGTTCQIAVTADRRGLRLVVVDSAEVVAERHWPEVVLLIAADRGHRIDTIVFDARRRSIDYEVAIGTHTWRVAGRTGAMREFER